MYMMTYKQNKFKIQKTQFLDGYDEWLYYFFMHWKISLNYPCYPFLSVALIKRHYSIFKQARRICAVWPEINNLWILRNLYGDPSKDSNSTPQMRRLSRVHNINTFSCLAALIERVSPTN